MMGRSLVDVLAGADDDRARCSSSCRTRTTTRCAPASTRSATSSTTSAPRRAGRSIASIAIRSRPRTSPATTTRARDTRRAVERWYDARAGSRRRRRGAAAGAAADRRAARRRLRRRRAPARRRGARAARSPASRHADLDVRGARHASAATGRCSRTSRARRTRSSTAITSRCGRSSGGSPASSSATRRRSRAAHRARRARTRVWAGLFRGNERAPVDAHDARRSTTTRSPRRRSRSRRDAERRAARSRPWAWIALAIPALYQLVLLATAIGGRIAYPYDLEWMEGGMLHHALRIQTGHGIYNAPSIDFIPYLYTPLYPALLAMLGEHLRPDVHARPRDLGAVARRHRRRRHRSSICAPRFRHARVRPAVVGSIARARPVRRDYPYVEGWYDLVRADTLFLFLDHRRPRRARWSGATKATGSRGHGASPRSPRSSRSRSSRSRPASSTSRSAASIVLVVAWRRLPTYIAVGRRDRPRRHRRS